MSPLLFVVIGIVVIIAGMMFFIFRNKTNKENVNNKPYLLSFVALSLLILYWVVYLVVLYLTDYYIVIAGKMGDFVFTPLLFIVSIIGLIAAYKEFKNNRTFAVIVGGLAIVNSIVGILLWAMGNM